MFGSIMSFARRVPSRQLSSSRGPVRGILPFFMLAGCSGNDDVRAPAIASIVPAQAAPGTTVMLLGSSFCQQPEPPDGTEVDPLTCAHVGVVLLGTMSASTLEYTDTSIMFEVPVTEPATLDVQVSVNGRRSNAVDLVIE